MHAAVPLCVAEQVSLDSPYQFFGDAALNWPLTQQLNTATVCLKFDIHHTPPKYSLVTIIAAWHNYWLMMNVRYFSYHIYIFWKYSLLFMYHHLFIITFFHLNSVSLVEYLFHNLYVSIYTYRHTHKHIIII